MSEIFAVIDTETNYNNNLISVGVVAVDSTTLEIVGEYYGIFDPEYKTPSMYAYVLNYRGVPINNVARYNVIVKDLILFLNSYGIKKIFAYNARFDFMHLPDLHIFEWYDIMRLAAYQQYNYKITERFECCKTGRLKCHYGVEDIYRLLSDNYRYCEVHNALADARDELEIIRMLKLPLFEYYISRIN